MEGGRAPVRGNLEDVRFHLYLKVLRHGIYRGQKSLWEVPSIVHVSKKGREEHKSCIIDLLSAHSWVKGQMKCLCWQSVDVQLKTTVQFCSYITLQTFFMKFLSSCVFMSTTHSVSV